MMLNIESALTVHLVGHNTRTPGLPGAISPVRSLKILSRRGGYFINLVISCVVSRALFIVLYCIA